MTTEAREANPDQVTPMGRILGSTRTMNWISNCGGLMTLLQPSHPYVSRACQQRPSHWEASGTQRACISQDRRGPVGSWSSSCSASSTSPSHVGGPVEIEEDKPLEQEAIDLDVTIPVFTSEDAVAVIISDDEVTSFPGGWPEAVSTPKLEVTGATSDPRRTRVHAHLLGRSRLQKNQRKVNLLVKQLS